MKWLRATCALFLLPSIVLAATPSNPPPVTNGVLVWYWDGTKSVVVTPTAPLPTTATISGSVTVNSAASAATSPPTYSAGANPLSQNLSGGLRVQISLSGTDIGLGQQVKAASIPVAIASDQVVPVTTSPGARTLVTLDVKTVTTGGTAVTALASGHKSAGGWIQNPPSATINLCINEIGAATGTTSSGDTTCIAPGQAYNLIPSSGAVSVISSDNSHPFSGYGLQ